MKTTKVKKFWSKKAALAAVEECQGSGWSAGVLGTSAPFIVQAIESATGFLVKYDLHNDGRFVEYSRKSVAA